MNNKILMAFAAAIGAEIPIRLSETPIKRRRLPGTTLVIEDENERKLYDAMTYGCKEIVRDPKYDIEAIEKARLKRERKAKLKRGGL